MILFSVLLLFLHDNILFKTWLWDNFEGEEHTHAFLYRKFEKISKKVSNFAPN